MKRRAREEQRESEEKSKEKSKESEEKSKEKSEEKRGALCTLNKRTGGGRVVEKRRRTGRGSTS